MVLFQVILLVAVESKHFCGPTWWGKNCWGAYVSSSWNHRQTGSLPPEKGLELTTEGGLLSYFLETLSERARVRVVQRSIVMRRGMFNSFGWISMLHTCCSDQWDCGSYIVKRVFLKGCLQRESHLAWEGAIDDLPQVTLFLMRWISWGCAPGLVNCLFCAFRKPSRYAFALAVSVSYQLVLRMSQFDDQRRQGCHLLFFWRFLCFSLQQWL